MRLKDRFKPYLGKIKTIGFDLDHTIA